MKVRELIEELKRIDPELELRISWDSGFYGTGCEFKDIETGPGVNNVNVRTSDEDNDFAVIWPDSDGWPE